MHSVVGTSTYLEALLPCMTMPLLMRLQIYFFGQLSFSLPHLLQFLRTIENFWFGYATFIFGEKVSMSTHSCAVAKRFSLHICVESRHLDWQVASTVQIIGAFFLVVDLTLKYTNCNSMSSEGANEADWSQWHELLRLFRKLKRLHIAGDLIQAFSCSLESEDGESPMELLPELKVLSYSGSCNGGDAFNRSIASQKNTGHPIALIHCHNPL